jgi:hypothetical protein
VRRAIASVPVRGREDLLYERLSFDIRPGGGNLARGPRDIRVEINGEIHAVAVSLGGRDAAGILRNKLLCKELRSLPQTRADPGPCHFLADAGSVGEDALFADVAYWNVVRTQSPSACR